MRGSNDKIVIVRFGAEWCSVSRNLATHLENLANYYTSNQNIIFVSADVDKCGGSAYEYQVSSIPSTKIFMNGQVKRKVNGANINEIKLGVEACIGLLSTCSV